MVLGGPGRVEDEGDEAEVPAHVLRVLVLHEPVDVARVQPVVRDLLTAAVEVRRVCVVFVLG